MRPSTRLAFLLALALIATAALASYSDLQVTAVTVSGSAIGVSLHNPNAAAESARIRVKVRYTDGTSQTLTSAPVTVAASGNVVVIIPAGKAIAGIDDDPVPINP